MKFSHTAGRLDSSGPKQPHPEPSNTQAAPSRSSSENHKESPVNHPPLDRLAQIDEVLLRYGYISSQFDKWEGDYVEDDDEKDTEVKAKVLRSLAEAVEPSEQTKLKLRVFKRVHLRASNPFLWSMRSVDWEPLQRFDFDRIRMEFPNAPHYLVVRLARASVGRKCYLSYCQSRLKAEELVSGLVDVEKSFLEICSDAFTSAQQGHKCPICFRPNPPCSYLAWMQVSIATKLL